MPLFQITLREHTYTGRFYNDVVEAGSFEEALQLAARPGHRIPTAAWFQAAIVLRHVERAHLRRAVL